MSGNVFLNYIGGEWKKSSSGGELLESYNPSKKNEVVGSVQNSTRSDLNEAIARAKDAQKAWRKLSGAERGNYLYQAATFLEENLEEIATTMTKEMGKSFPEAQGETTRGIQILKYYAGGRHEI